MTPHQLALAGVVTPRGRLDAHPDSEDCGRIAHRRASKARRNKRIRSTATRETIGHVYIARRDGWKCHICGKRVTRSNWSLDHLEPLADGGTHTRANVKLAHHRCNSLRGRTGAAQLMLVG